MKVLLFGVQTESGGLCYVWFMSGTKCFIFGLPVFYDHVSHIGSGASIVFSPSVILSRSQFPAPRCGFDHKCCLEIF